MLKSFTKARWLLFWGSLALVNAACNMGTFSQESGANVASTEVASPQVVEQSTAPKSATPQPTAAPTAKRPDPYATAVDRATSAATLGRSAQSQDDWRLVMNRWQQAIDLMAAVPRSHPNYGKAQTHLSDYRQKLATARQQSQKPVNLPSYSPPQPQRQSPETTIAAVPRPVSSPPSAPADRPASSQSPMAATDSRVFSVPIVRRAGSTPVIQVNFNGSQAFEMIVDTGATGTLITQPMATALGVVPVSQTRVDTASAQGVTLPMGYVTSMEAGGLEAQNVLVAVAGPQLGIGLLGHDFFGNYDVTIREHEVEFRSRS
jgi:predicted aspartyl protease